MTSAKNPGQQCNRRKEEGRETRGANELRRLHHVVHLRGENVVVDTLRVLKKNTRRNKRQKRKKNNDNKMKSFAASITLYTCVGSERMLLIPCEY